jgi:hypothetical protein
MLPSVARNMGYTIDNHCYPWVAYKGPRFRPDAIGYCYTDVEEICLRALGQIENDSEDELSRLCAKEASIRAAR